MTDKQRRQADMIRSMICTDDERRQVLAELAQRRAVLLVQRAEIDEELRDMEAIEMGHRAALTH
jgi:predicted Fe-S protein YdhL (DUF1289 family)